MSVKFYRNICRRFSGIVKRYFRMEVIGAENEPEDNGTPLLICSNHLSMADVTFLAANMKRQIRFLAKEELFHVPLLGWFVKKMDAIPIRRGQSDVAAIKAVLKVLESGGTACVYPQGHRYTNVNPKDTEIRHGAAMMIWRSKCDVLPAAMIGKGWKIRPFRKNRIVFGSVIRYDELNMTSGTPEEYKRVSEEVFSRITELCDRYEIR